MVLSIVLATIAAGLVGGLLSWIAVRRSLGVIFTGIITLIFALAFENLLLGLGGGLGRVGLFHLVGSRRLPATPDFALLRDAGSSAGVPAGLRSAEAVPSSAGHFAPCVTTRLRPSWPVSMWRYRVYAALIGAAMLGMAGATYAFSEGRISPTTLGSPRWMWLSS